MCRLASLTAATLPLLFPLMASHGAEAAPLISMSHVSVAPDIVKPAGAASVRFTVTSGSTQLRNVKARLALTSYGGQSIYAIKDCSLGDLPVGRSIPVEATLAVPPDLANGLYGLSLSFTSATPDLTIAPAPNVGSLIVGAAHSDIAGARPARLTFIDDFVGAKLNGALWRPNLPFPANSNPFETQTYKLDNIILRGGVAQLVAKRSGQEITSGLLSSFGAFAQRYGRFEMRAKLPRGNGLWPAFWLLPEDQSWPPEIDIVELLGREPGKVFATNHWRAADGGNRQASVAATAADYTQDFHLYMVDWRPGLMRFMVDGKEIGRQTTHVPDKPMYLVANLAVASGGWPGSFDATTPFPAQMEIDFIRAYQFDDLDAPAPPPLRFRKTTLSTVNPSPGEGIELSSGLETGREDLADLKLHVFLRSFDGKTQLAYQQLPFGDAPKQSIIPFGMRFAIPDTLAPGLYTLAYAITTAKGENIYDNLVQRLSIQRRAH